MNLLFISDYSAAEINGGAELCNDVIIKDLKADFIKSIDFTSGAGYDKVILSNCWQLNPVGRRWLVENGYCAKIEHDFQIFPSRIAPTQSGEVQLVNVDLYQAAKTVVFQSKVQAGIFNQLIKLNSYILGGNLWSDEEFILFSAAPNEKNGKFCIPESSSASKGMEQSIQIAQFLRIPFDIVPKMPYLDFVRLMGEYSGLINQNLILESFNRQLCEMKMMGGIVLANSNSPCTEEEWWNWPRFEIISEMKKKRGDLINFLKE